MYKPLNMFLKLVYIIQFYYLVLGLIYNLLLYQFQNENTILLYTNITLDLVL